MPFPCVALAALLLLQAMPAAPMGPASAGDGGSRETGGRTRRRAGAGIDPDMKLHATFWLRQCSREPLPYAPPLIPGSALSLALASHEAMATTSDGRPSGGVSPVGPAWRPGGRDSHAPRRALEAKAFWVLPGEAADVKDQMHVHAGGMEEAAALAFLRLVLYRQRAVSGSGRGGGGDTSGEPRLSASARGVLGDVCQLAELVWQEADADGRRYVRGSAQDGRQLIGAGKAAVLSRPDLVAQVQGLERLWLGGGRAQDPFPRSAEDVLAGTCLAQGPRGSGAGRGDAGARTSEGCAGVGGERGRQYRRALVLAQQICMSAMPHHVVSVGGVMHDGRASAAEDDALVDASPVAGGWHADDQTAQALSEGPRRPTREPAIPAMPATGPAAPAQPVTAAASEGEPEGQQGCVERIFLRLLEEEDRAYADMMARWEEAVGTRNRPRRPAGDSLGGGGCAEGLAGGLGDW